MNRLPFLPIAWTLAIFAAVVFTVDNGALVSYINFELSNATGNEVNDLEIKVDASELKREKGDLIKGLEGFLKEKTSADVTEASEMVTVKGEGDAVTKKYLKVLLKKFLHKRELKESFRVIMDEDGALKVKERRKYEEE